MQVVARNEFRFLRKRVNETLVELKQSFMDADIVLRYILYLITFCSLIRKLSCFLL